MSIRSGSLVLGAAALLASLPLFPGDARACGGCFHPPDSESTVVTGHRMALSVSPDRTVLWDQVEYSGNPEEFAWVLPVKTGARLELSTDAFFEALDAATATNVVPPSIYCPGDFYEGDYGDYGSGNSGCGFGCGSLDAAEALGTGAGAGGGGPNQAPTPDPVTVVHQETVGPYETVTIHSNIPGSLYTWLADHNYAVDDPIKPVIDAYESEGFEFIALRLVPGANVNQMQPVRVITPGASPVLPLRMVAAGTGANVAITLFVIGEGRWEAQNFENGLVDTEKMSWDFNTSTSSYGERRQEALAGFGGESWLTTYAYQGSLLSSTYMDGYPGGAVSYFTADENPASSIYELYVQQAFLNAGQPSDEGGCLPDALIHADSNDKVVDVCAPAGDGGGGAGGSAGGAGGAGGSAGGAGGGGNVECTAMPGAGEIDSRAFACEGFDDFAVALTGLHPSGVWLTRLEANLPQAALAQDMALQAEATQSHVDNWIAATDVVNPPCKDYQYFLAPPQSPPARRPPPPRGHRDLIVLGIGLATIATALARRLARRAPARPALAPREMA